MNFRRRSPAERAARAAEELARREDPYTVTQASRIYFLPNLMTAGNLFEPTHKMVRFTPDVVNWKLASLPLTTRTRSVAFSATLHASRSLAREPCLHLLKKRPI